MTKLENRVFSLFLTNQVALIMMILIVRQAGDFMLCENIRTTIFGILFVGIATYLGKYPITVLNQSGLRHEPTDLCYSNLT